VTTGARLTVVQIAAALAVAAPAEGQVWGTVLDSAGRPHTRALVDVSGPGFMRRTGTDGQGGYIVWDAPPGQTLTVQALDDHGGFSRRRSFVPPDTVPPLVLPVRRDSRGMRIDSAQVTRDIHERDPEQRGYGCLGQQCAMSYPANVGRVYCWTIVRGTTTPRTIRHVWYWEDHEMARIDLVARGPSWRTWSSKRIDPSWNGRWRIDVLADDGTLLITRYFHIESDRDTVRPPELRRVVARSMYDALFYLRPRWFRWEPRPYAGFVEPRVYVDGVFKGQGWLATHDLPVSGVRLVYRVTADPDNPAGWRLEIRR